MTNRLLAHTLARQAASRRSSYIASPLRKIGAPTIARAVSR